MNTTQRCATALAAVMLTATLAAWMPAAQNNPAPPAAAPAKPTLHITWKDNILSVHGEHIPGGKIDTWYLEAYCRPGSTDRDWNETTIGHKTEMLHASDDRKHIQLQCTLTDGVIVKHDIRAGDDEVVFSLTAHNPTEQPSQAHWAQPCTRVGDFTGLKDPDDKYKYISRCFIFHDGKPAFMPTRDWATRARYIPGQVWCPKHVDRNDVNPRPLNPNPPGNGLIGCVSAKGDCIFATAWEPYQELFQGVIYCIHSDFRLGGLKPGETKKIRGKMYIVPGDMQALIKRYEKDFPEHAAK